MKEDLGEQQTVEMRSFYERMSQQIKVMCTHQDMKIEEDTEKLESQASKVDPQILSQKSGDKAGQEADQDCGGKGES